MKITPLTKRLGLIFSFSVLLFLSACGDDTAAPTKLLPVAHAVTVTIGLSGSPETMIGSVDLAVTLPAGFVLETDSSGQPTNRALSFLVASALADVNYVSATGEINAAIIKTEGFAGNADLLQISGTYPANAILPTADKFIVTAVAYDFTTTAVNDISNKVNISIQLAP